MKKCLKMILILSIIVLSSCSNFLSQNSQPSIFKDTESKSTKNKVVIEYFWQKKCSDCKRAEPVLKSVNKDFNYIVFLKYDCALEKNIKLFREKCIKFNILVKERMDTPTLFIGNKYLVNDDITYGNLKEMITEKQKLLEKYSEYEKDNYFIKNNFKK
jgi:thiol-disulfide isomerase/thioredoxin